MDSVWLAIAAMTLISFVIKAAGPVILGGRELPREAERVIVLLPAALLTGLVTVQTFASDRDLVVDERAAGVAVAVVAAALRASVLVVLLLAGATTAGLRAL
jgi:branched-subunit amino acid transport protein